MRRRTLTCIAVAGILFCASPGVDARHQDQKPQPAAAEIPPSRHAGQPVNVKLDLVITDQRAGATGTTPRTVTMTVADRDRGQLRTNGAGDQILNVDALPEVVRDGKIRVRLTFDYRAPKGEGDSSPPMLTHSLSSLVDDGKALTVTQWSEAGSNRTIRVELRASIQK